MIDLTEALKPFGRLFDIKNGFITEFHNASIRCGERELIIESKNQLPNEVTEELIKISPDSTSEVTVDGFKEVFMFDEEIKVTAYRPFELELIPYGKSYVVVDTHITIYPSESVGNYTIVPFDDFYEYKEPYVSKPTSLEEMNDAIKVTYLFFKNQHYVYDIRHLVSLEYKCLRERLNKECEESERRISNLVTGYIYRMKSKLIDPRDYGLTVTRYLDRKKKYYGIKAEDDSIE